MALSKSSITRRTTLLGGLTMMLPLTVPGIANALSFGVKNRVAPVGQGGRNSANSDLGPYLCQQVHDKIALNLDRIIADPAIDGEQTALALMEAHCPGCRQRIHPNRSAISAVIPKWQWNG